MRCRFAITLKQLRGDDIDQGLCCYDIIVDLFVVLITICITMINIRFMAKIPWKAYLNISVPEISYCILLKQ